MCIHFHCTCNIRFNCRFNFVKIKRYADLDNAAADSVIRLQNTQAD